METSGSMNGSGQAPAHAHASCIYLATAMRGWRTLDEHPLDTQAKRVQLEHNNLSALPRAIGSLTFMLKLDVCAAARRGNKTAALLEHHSSRSHNMLETLPKSICKCTRLRVLYVDHNKLEELPKEVGNLFFLEELNVRGAARAHRDVPAPIRMFS